MGSVRVYTPTCEVTLFKTIGREKLAAGVSASVRFSGSRRRLDLTPFLAESGIVRTTKSQREPAGGFTIALGDLPNKDGGIESLYGFIEPMDMVEIRFTHNDDASRRIGSTPLVMRGFVTSVRRDEAMAENGQPSRRVIIQGQDYGKIWQIAQLQYFANNPIAAQYLTSFKLFDKYGKGFETSTSVQKFLADMIGILNSEFLSKIVPTTASQSFPSAIDTSRIDPIAAEVTPFQTQQHEGTFYDTMRFFGDVGPWNELFIEDEEDGVYCVYRRNPFRAAGQRAEYLASDLQTKPATVEISADDVMAISVERSDADVANFFWVDAPNADVFTNPIIPQFGATGEITTVDIGGYTEQSGPAYQNASAVLYGLRMIQERSQQWQLGMMTSGGQQADKNAKQTSDVMTWLKDRRLALIDQNKDNVLFERGTIRMRGNERIKAGQYVRVKRGTFVADYYVTRVDHEFVPQQRFVTTLTVERGTGFIERARDGAAESPYLAEMARGE